MEETKVNYIPVGHATKLNYKTNKINRFFKENKVKLFLLFITLSLIVSYVVLFNNFVKLLLTL